MKRLFQLSKFNGNISEWDVSNVTNMSYMFHSTPFNQPIGNWDVSNVTNMEQMFSNNDMFNKDLNSWNTISVTNMSGMFRKADRFNKPLNNWNTSNVRSMNWMFSNARNFNQPLNNWNVSKVEGADCMFMGSQRFDQNISNWKFDSLKHLTAMFYECGIDINNIMFDFKTEVLAYIYIPKEGFFSFHDRTKFPYWYFLLNKLPIPIKSLPIDWTKIDCETVFNCIEGEDLLYELEFKSQNLYFPEDLEEFDKTVPNFPFILYDCLEELI